MRAWARAARGAVLVLVLDQLTKLLAVGHLTPAAAVDAQELAERRRAVASMGLASVFRASWRARSPCAGRAEACPRQWLIGDWAALRYVENAGAAWASPAARPGPVARRARVAAGAAAVALGFGAAVWFPPAAIALGVLVGGILGNLLDRLRLDYVIDFVELRAGSWVGPVFNLADLAITVGFVWALARIRRPGRSSLPDPGRTGMQAPCNAAGRS